MKMATTDSELNKKRGLRLKECREYRKLTQESLAKEYHITPTYLSMLECGSRLIDWDKAQKLADILCVNPAYIMLESDNMLRGQRTDGYEENGNMDNGFIRFLISSGHTLSFHVVVLYDGKQPTEKDWHGMKVKDWKSLQIDARLDELKDFCFSDNHCMLQTDNGLSECIITEVCFDGLTMKYGHFVYHIYRLYDYIQFTLNSLKEFESDMENLNADDEIAQMEVEDSRSTTNGIYPDERKMLDDIEAHFGKDAIKKITVEEALAYLINRDKN